MAKIENSIFIGNTANFFAATLLFYTTLNVELFNYTINNC